MLQMAWYLAKFINALLRSSPIPVNSYLVLTNLIDQLITEVIKYVEPPNETILLTNIDIVALVTTSGKGKVL